MHLEAYVSFLGICGCNGHRRCKNGTKGQYLWILARALNEFHENFNNISQLPQCSQENIRDGLCFWEI